MSKPISVTFIGGEADLTRRVYNPLPPTINVAVMPDLSATYKPGYEPEKVLCRYDTYIVHQVTGNHAVAVLDHYHR